MIEIDGISKTYGAAQVVRDISFSVPAGTITVIVGTSGSGKTTLLRMINRLVEPTSGTIRIDGEDNRTLAPYELRRRIGYVIQGHGLFPHRTVADNIATVPNLLGWPKQKTKDRVQELLQLFQLDPHIFAGRYPHELSGGQSQRVGVARALAAGPKLLLMDEPFGALDPVIRGKAQEDLLGIQKRFGTTIVLVTHDMNEAFALADHIAVVDEGRLVQHASPQEILVCPANPFVESLIGGVEHPFRLLSLTGLRDLVEPGEAAGEPVAVTLSRRDALAELLWSGRQVLPVTDPTGAVLGRVTLERLVKAAARPA
jgi:osmoprotectant transport system ATP-binding protein